VQAGITEAQPSKERYRHLQDVSDAMAALGTEAPARLLGVWRESQEFVNEFRDRIVLVVQVLEKAGTLSGEAVEILWDGMRVDSLPCPAADWAARDFLGSVRSSPCLPSVVTWPFSLFRSLP
jgi:hypothetical protein